MEHAWSILCSSSSIDKDQNRLSLFDLVEGIQFAPPDAETPDEAISALPFDLTLVSMWWRSDPKVEELGHQRVLLKSPDGRSLLPEAPEVQINLSKTNRRFRWRIKFAGLPYAGSGIYRFVIQYRLDEDTEWQEVNSVPVEITRVSPESIANRP